MLIWWWVACKRTVVAAVIALIGYAHFVAPQCINTIVGAVVGTISAVLVFAHSYHLRPAQLASKAIRWRTRLRLDFGPAVFDREST